MRHLSARLHALYNGLFQPKPRMVALAAYQEAQAGLELQGLLTEAARMRLAHLLADEALAIIDTDLPDSNREIVHRIETGRDCFFETLTFRPRFGNF